MQNFTTETLCLIKAAPVLATMMTGLTQERPGFHALRLNRRGSLQEGLGLFVMLRHEGQDAAHHQAVG